MSVDILRRLRRLVAAAAAFAVASVPVQAQEAGREKPRLRIDASSRCGTQALLPWEEELVERELRQTMRSFREQSIQQGFSFIPPYWGRTIPVYIHFIRPASHGIPYETLTRLQISQQIAVLNAAYDVNADPGNTEFNFVLAGTTITYNNAWFQDCGDDNEAAMKSALAVDPAHNLNVYVCGGITIDDESGVLGYSYLPAVFSEDSFMHGVVVLTGTFPGGSLAPYNEGDTMTHEVGHYLGLDHTFKGGCTSTNDHVSDTPQEKIPAFGCPYGRDTCPSDPGIDPVLNFMDYTDDDCMNHFTKGQKWRMKFQVTTFKPSL